MMGDRTYTTIKFGGKITREQAEELIQELEGQGCLCDATDTDDLKVEMLADSYFYDSECNYGQMEGVEDFCREHGIAYEKTWEAGGGYGPGVMIFTGTGEIECGTIDGEPAITLSQVKELGVSFYGFLESFNFNEPLVIIDD